MGVVVEPDRSGITRELLGAAAQLDAHVVALTLDDVDLDDLGGWGADHVVACTGIAVANEEDTAAGRRRVGPRRASRGRCSRPAPRGGARWPHASRPTSVPGSPATRSSSTPTDDELIAWKPAFGGQIVAAIHCATRPQMATVRAGVLPTRTPRRHVPTADRRAGEPAEPRSGSRPGRATTTSTSSPTRRS